MWSFLFKLVFSGKKEKRKIATIVLFLLFFPLLLSIALSFLLSHFILLSTTTKQQDTKKKKKNSMTEIPILCRVQALYPFKSNDPSSLSFEQDDYIEVLTKLPSGWWDGL